MLVSRAAELGALDGLLARLRAAEGSALLVRGDPGIGKTALLDALLDRAGSDVAVLRARGLETEAELRVRRAVGSAGARRRQPGLAPGSASGGAGRRARARPARAGRPPRRLRRHGGAAAGGRGARAGARGRRRRPLARRGVTRVRAVRGTAGRAAPWAPCWRRATPATRRSHGRGCPCCRSVRWTRTPRSSSCATPRRTSRRPSRPRSRGWRPATRWHWSSCRRRSVTTSAPGSRPSRGRWPRGAACRRPSRRASRSSTDRPGVRW